MNLTESTEPGRQVRGNRVAGLRQTESIRGKVVRGAAALGVGNIVGRGLRFVRMMILARLLVPDEFGLMSIVTAMTMAFEAVSEVGVKQSVIQNVRGEEADYLNVAWWVQVVRGIALFVTAVLAAPWISGFYHKPELLPLLRVAFLSILFKAMISPRAHVLEKHFKFGWVVFLTQGSSVLATIISVILAVLLRSVWALVIGFVAEAGLLALMSYVFFPFRPRVTVDKGCFGEIMRYARGMFGLPLLTMVSMKLDVLVLAKMVSEKRLGLYSLALALAYVPVDLFARTINPVLLPALAAKQNDKNALGQTILRTCRLFADFCVPVASLMGACASGLLLLAYGSEYVAVAAAFSVLSFGVLAWTQNTVFANAYLAVGKPNLYRWVVGIRALTLLCIIYPAIRIAGVTGAAAAFVLCNFIPLVLQFAWAERSIGLGFASYIGSLMPSLVWAAPVVVAVVLARLVGVRSPLIALIVGFLAFALVMARQLLVLRSSGGLGLLGGRSREGASA